MTVPVERPFLPTTAEVKALYIEGRFDGNYASFVELNEYNLGFDQWLDAVKSAEVAALRRQIDTLEAAKKNVTSNYLIQAGIVDRVRAEVGLRNDVAKKDRPSSDENGEIDPVAFERDHWKIVALAAEATIARAPHGVSLEGVTCLWYDTGKCDCWKAEYDVAKEALK